MFNNGLPEGSLVITTQTDQISKTFKPSNISEGKLTVEATPRVLDFRVDFM
jgi:hypothetical protein